MKCYNKLVKENPLVKKESKEPTPRPNLLDVVNVDGRFAQVRIGGNHIKYLDNESVVEIDWSEYSFLKPSLHKTHVIDLVRENKISEKEYRVIHWGSEQK